MKNLTNLSFGDYTVLGEVTRSRTNFRRWLCKCKCGREVIVHQSNLMSGGANRCLFCRKHYLKHGLAGKHRLYSTWKSMRNRCNNPDTQHYKNYGGRGITVCKNWDNFSVFVQDMESGFKEGLTLERKDNSKGYSKENCTWATPKEQGNNQRTNLKLYYQGEYITEAELSRKTGIKRTTLQSRRKRGASVEEMIYGIRKI